MPALTNRGSTTILSALLATLVFSLSIYTFGLANDAARRAAEIAHDRVLAEAYASELTEFFRSMSVSALDAYLSKNPATGQTAMNSRYYYCSHINLFNRYDNFFLNRDPIAALPMSRLDRGNSQDMNANRWYTIQVVDKYTMKPTLSYCNQRIGETPIADNETYLVTVGVNYYSRGNANPPKGKSSVEVYIANMGTQSMTKIASGSCTACKKSQSSSVLNRVVLSTLLLKDLSNDY